MRPVRDTAERAEWDRLMGERHYLGFRGMFGDGLRQVAGGPDGEWLALVGWCAEAFKVGARDARIGWAREPPGPGRLRGLCDHLRQVPEFRSAWGVRHSLASVQRILSGVDADALDRAVRDFAAARHPPEGTLAIDGKSAPLNRPGGAHRRQGPRADRGADLRPRPPRRPARRPRAPAGSTPGVPDPPATHPPQNPGDRHGGQARPYVARPGPAEVLALNRGRWEIENRFHYVRDFSRAEDRSRIRSGKLP